MSKRGKRKNRNEKLYWKNYILIEDNNQNNLEDFEDININLWWEEEYIEDNFIVEEEVIWWDSMNDIVDINININPIKQWREIRNEILNFLNMLQEIGFPITYIGKKNKIIISYKWKNTVIDIVSWEEYEYFNFMEKYKKILKKMNLIYYYYMFEKVKDYEEIEKINTLLENLKDFDF